MARRAPLCFSVRLPVLALTVGLAAAALQLGCGGGGGGGNTPPVLGDCGTTGTVPNLCGRVIGNLSNGPVAGATVYLKDANGNNVGSTQTAADGTYHFSPIPAGTALFWVEPPATGFNGNMNMYQQKEYAINRPNKAGNGPCVMAVGTLPTGDRNLGDVVLSQEGGPPPQPVFDCPR